MLFCENVFIEEIGRQLLPKDRRLSAGERGQCMRIDSGQNQKALLKLPPVMHPAGGLDAILRFII
jgi:hypothetical protein